MKLVQFTRPLFPFRPGDERVVPDAVAQQLVADGDAVHLPSVFDPPAPLEKPRAPRRYHTRGSA